MGRLPPIMLDTTVDGRYVIAARVASGGMGEVYRAHDPVLDREVAIKVLHRSFADDPGFIERFRREARAAAMLSHPNIVAIHDWGETAGTYFMVMEYIRGPNLRTLLLRDGALAPSQAVDVVSQVLAALEHAHRQGLVPRDIKPENVMVRASDGAVKVTDFGLARALADARISQAPGTVTGTVQYLAPEQIEGFPADPRTDLYATGIVLYELLTGQVPFSGETSVAIAYKHLRDRVPPPSRSNPMVPPSLDQVVLSATERDPEGRTRDAYTMRLDVARVAPDLPPAEPLAELAANAAPREERGPDRAATVTIPRVEPRARRRRRVAMVVGILALLATLGVAAWAAVMNLRPVIVATPDIEGRSVAEAQRLAEARGLEFAISRERFSSSVPANVVISQRPPAGERVEEGTPLSVVVSRGPELTEVPNVVGDPIDRARRRLRRAELRLSVARAYSDDVPEGRVIEQSLNPGSRPEVGEEITVTVSRGEPPVEVQNVVGLPEGDAVSVLEEQGLVVEVRRENSSDVRKGLVISQDPPTGNTVPAHSSVTIVVSQGPARFPMPDVVGDSREAAVEQLEELGLVVAPLEVPGSDGNTVVGQRPSAGTTVRQGDRVRIYIGG
ncbi:MAG TPA: Stk1 family PASTA domain-containing Ser/Thr kinase [Actinomycetota bacterium]|nr:Stk1 family PASTA domain-containing Ser/Thr kinase [Actinomycetota bacterium]